LSEIEAVLLRVSSADHWDVKDRAMVVRPNDRGTVVSYDLSLAAMPLHLERRWARFTETADMIMNLPLACRHAVER
jgi:hypothetical protein